MVIVILIILHSLPTFVMTCILIINILQKWCLMHHWFIVPQESSLIRLKLFFTGLHSKIERDLWIIQLVCHRNTIDGSLFIRWHVSNWLMEVWTSCIIHWLIHFVHFTSLLGFRSTLPWWILIHKWWSTTWSSLT